MPISIDDVRTMVNKSKLHRNANKVIMKPKEALELAEGFLALLEENRMILKATRPFVDCVNIYDELPDTEDPIINLGGNRCLPVLVEDLRCLQKTHDIILEAMAKRGKVKEQPTKG